MNVEQILTAQTTKTEKMLRLFELGKTRTEVAHLLGVGYGFVQNVYARRYGVRRTRRSNNTFDFKFGVEIEAMGINRSDLERALNEAGITTREESYNHTTRSHWKIVSDASIQGTSAFELVSPVLLGEQGLNTLQTICEVLERLGAKINKSCGLHIHFDASEFNIKTWGNLFYNYAIAEQSIDAMMPNSRRDNHYCKSVRVRDYNNRFKNFETLEELTNVIFAQNRYHKVNCQSYWRHRTVEFRQHSGTVEFNKIKNWVLILTQLIKFSKENTFNTGTQHEFASILNEEQKQYYKQRVQKFS